MMLMYLGTRKDAQAQVKNKMDRSGEETKQEGRKVCISVPCNEMSAPRKRLGDCLVEKSVFISVPIFTFLMSDGSENRISKFKVLYATSW